MKTFVKFCLVLGVLATLGLSGYAATTVENNVVETDSESGIVFRQTLYYVSGDDKIVLYSSGSFQLRSGSQVLYTGTYNIDLQNKEICFTIDDCVFYGSYYGDNNAPSSISFTIGGTRYRMTRQTRN